MKSCAFFGPRVIDVDEYGEKLLQILTDLIENKGVTQFYSGFRGTFDVYCSRLVHKLKSKYPQIKNTMVLSYIPQANISSDQAFVLPEYFDDSVYLLERAVPYRYAIIETNKCLVDLVDCVVTLAIARIGGAYRACEYAHRKNKPIYNVFDEWNIFD